MPTPRPSSPFARRRWTPEDARAVIVALERSGKSVSTFAVEHGLDPQRVYLWRRRLGKAEPTTFREIVVHASPSRADGPRGDAAFEIALTSGIVVRVPASFDEAALARLLEVLVRVREC
jgi:transposase-like protein